MTFSIAGSRRCADFLINFWEAKDKGTFGKKGIPHPVSIQSPRNKKKEPRNRWFLLSLRYSLLMPQANCWGPSCYSPQLFCGRTSISNTANQNLPQYDHVLNEPGLGWVMTINCENHHWIWEDSSDCASKRRSGNSDNQRETKGRTKPTAEFGFISG